VSAINTQNKVVDTAVIPLAGLGTRMGPYTAGSPKFMAPIYVGKTARPNIDFTLDDCLDAGIKNLIFVTSNGGDDVLRGYLGPMSKETRERYVTLGNFEQLEKEQARREAYAELNITYVNQGPGAYGTAIPLSLVRSALKGTKYFAISGGDDFVWNPYGVSELGLQIAQWHQSDAASSVMGVPVARSDGNKYGILQPTNTGNLAQIIEKPPVDSLPERRRPLANISRYILSDDIWSYLDVVLNTPRDAHQPEYYITDVINLAVLDGVSFDVHRVQGRYFDAGSPQGAHYAGHTITKLLRPSLAEAHSL